MFAVIFVSLAWPYDPMEITEAIVTELQATGVAKTKYVKVFLVNIIYSRNLTQPIHRYTNRLEPVVISCHALSVEVVTRMTTELVTKDFNAWAKANNATHITVSHVTPPSRSEQKLKTFCCSIKLILQYDFTKHR